MLHTFSKALATNYVSCGCMDAHFPDQALGALLCHYGSTTVHVFDDSDSENVWRSKRVVH